MEGWERSGKNHQKQKLQVLSQTLACQQQAPFCQTDLVFALPATVDLKQMVVPFGPWLAKFTMIHIACSYGSKTKSISTSSGGSNCRTWQKHAPPPESRKGQGAFSAPAFAHDTVLPVANCHLRLGARKHEFKAS